MLTDFDGTLARIVDDPAGAVALPGAVEALHLLAERFATVAVVSGRRASFLARALRIGEYQSGLEAYGLYGAEHCDPTGAVTVDRGAALHAPAIAAACDELRVTVPTSLFVELKALSVTLHWRTAPAAQSTALAVAEAVAARHGLELHRGRMSVELLAPGAVDKGAVVRVLVAQCTTACFLGDDVGDVPAFVALSTLEHTGALRAVRVAVVSDEVPSALVDDADLLLDGPEEAVALLADLAGASGGD